MKVLVTYLEGRVQYTNVHICMCVYFMFNILGIDFLKNRNLEIPI